MIITRPFYDHHKIIETGFTDYHPLYHVRCLSHLALLVGSSKLGSTPFKDDATLAPKLADPLSSTPLITGSGILDPDRLSFCTIYTCQLGEIHYLETRSRCVNMSFIIPDFPDTGSSISTSPTIASSAGSPATSSASSTATWSSAQTRRPTRKVLRPKAKCLVDKMTYPSTLFVKKLWLLLHLLLVSLHGSKVS
jgi:hypothetical protein